MPRQRKKQTRQSKDMKHAITLGLALLLIASTALADNFQIAFSEGNSNSYVAYSAVRLYDGNNRQIFSGSTDKYGRIIIGNVNNGSYRIEITFRNKTCKKNIAIDHSTNFKIINITPADLAFNPFSSRSSNC